MTCWPAPAKPATEHQKDHPPPPAVAYELARCQAETGGRCDHDGRAWMTHHCQFNDDHNGAHECDCGHRWAEDDR